ncbi:hypothetical protein IAT40_002057 [Kwoniella sp. CBS 6097]
MTGGASSLAGLSRPAALSKKGRERRPTPPLELATRRRAQACKPSMAFFKYDSKLDQIRAKRYLPLNDKIDEEKESASKKRKTAGEIRLDQLRGKLGIPKESDVQQLQLQEQEGKGALRSFARNTGPTTLSRQAQSSRPSWAPENPTSVREIIQSYDKRQEERWGPLDAAENDIQRQSLDNGGGVMGEFADGGALPNHPRRYYGQHEGIYHAQGTPPSHHYILNQDDRAYHHPARILSGPNAHQYGQPPWVGYPPPIAIHHPYSTDPATPFNPPQPPFYAFQPDATSTPTKTRMWGREANDPRTSAPRSILKPTIGCHPPVQPQLDVRTTPGQHHLEHPFHVVPMAEVGFQLPFPMHLTPHRLDPIVGPQKVRFVSSSPERWQYSPAKSSASSIQQQVQHPNGSARYPPPSSDVANRFRGSLYTQGHPGAPLGLASPKASDNPYMQEHTVPAARQLHVQHPSHIQDAGHVNGFDHIRPASQAVVPGSHNQLPDVPNGYGAPRKTAENMLVEAHRGILEFKKQKKRERARAKAASEKWKEQTVVERLEQMAEEEDELDLLRPEIIGQDDWPPQQPAVNVAHLAPQQQQASLPRYPHNLGYHRHQEESDDPYSDSESESTDTSSTTSPTSDSEDESYYPAKRHSRSRSFDTHHTYIPSTYRDSNSRHQATKRHLKKADKTEDRTPRSQMVVTYDSASDTDLSDGTEASSSEDQENMLMLDAEVADDPDQTEEDDDAFMDSDDDASGRAEANTDTDEEDTESYHEPIRPTKRLSDIAASVVIPPNLLKDDHQGKVRPRKHSKTAKRDNKLSNGQVSTSHSNQSYSGLVRNFDAARKGTRYLKYPTGGLQPSSPAPTEASGPAEDIETFSEADDEGHREHGGDYDDTKQDDEMEVDIDEDIEGEEMQVEDVVKPLPQNRNAFKLKRFPKPWRDLPIIREDIEPEEEGKGNKMSQQGSRTGAQKVFSVGSNFNSSGKVGGGSGNESAQWMNGAKKGKEVDIVTDAAMQSGRVEVEDKVDEMEGFFSKDGGELGFTIWRDDY